MDDIGGYFYTSKSGKRIFVPYSDYERGRNEYWKMKNNQKKQDKYVKYYTKELDSIVISKYSNTKQNKMIVNDYNNYYIVENKDYGEYNIKQVIPISTKNKKLINSLQKGYDDNANQRANGTNRSVEQTKYGQGNSSGANTLSEREESWGEYIDKVLERIESERNNRGNNNK